MPSKLRPTWRKGTDGRRRGPYFRLVNHNSGQRSRMRVRRGWAPVVAYFQELEQQRDDLEDELAASVQARLTGGTRGRPAAMPPAAKALLELAGYQVYGSRIADPPGSWRDEQAMGVRFSLLSAQWQALIGSPDNLSRLLRRSWSRLKSANRRGVAGYTLEAALTVELLALESQDEEDGDEV